MELQSTTQTSNQNLQKKKLKLTLSQFHILNTIGKGSQGEVYEAQSALFPQKVAIKSVKLPTSNFRGEKIIKRIQNQILINTEIEESGLTMSNFFPRFHGYFFENDTFYLIFELCAFDALQVYKKLKTYAQKYTFCWIMLHDIIQSLSLLESKAFLHRDIKPENILFKNNFFKLADLGLARQTLGSRLTIGVGNIFSKSPQVYIGKYDTKSDVWSLGITLYYLLEGKLPYDNETIQLMMVEDRIQNYIERMKNKQFLVNVCQKQVSKNKNGENFLLYEIMSKMLIVPMEERYLASQVYSSFFKPIEIDQIDHEKVIKSITEHQKPDEMEAINQFLRCLLLKYLSHRESQLGLFNAITLGCVKEILQINKKISKISKILQANDGVKNQKKALEIQLLKNIKTACFKLLEVLLKLMIDESEDKQTVEPTTSFGQIQLTVQKPQKIVHEDHKKLQKFIDILLQSHNEYQSQNEQKENMNLKKQIEKEVIQKSVKFDNILTCISHNNSHHEIELIKMEEKSCSKIKSQKKLELMERNMKEKLPKSIKYINDQTEFQRGKQNLILDNFLKFYTKDKLKERFPLLGQIAGLLKKLIESSEDSLKRKILVQSDFKLWNLSLDLFRI